MDIYVHKDGQQQGPFTESRVRQGVDTGEFGSDDLAWIAGKASWQPLAALINLDVSKPPPMPTPVVLAEPILITNDHQPLPVTLSTPSVARGIKRDEAVKAEPPAGRRCKKCGAPYGIFSLDRAMFSGLCVRCSPPPKPKSKSVLYEPPPINSREDALKAIRNAGIFYAILFLVNIYLGANEDPVYFATALVILVCTFIMCSAQSRVAAILLLLLAIGGYASILFFQGIQGFGPVTMIIGVLQIGLTVNAVKATFKLQREFKLVVP